jgi:hypothetical protein
MGYIGQNMKLIPCFSLIQKVKIEFTWHFQLLYVLVPNGIVLSHSNIYCTAEHYSLLIILELLTIFKTVQKNEIAVIFP